MLAAGGTKKEIFKTLLTAGARADARDKDGRTAFMYAFTDASFDGPGSRRIPTLEIAETLLKRYKPALRLRDQRGYTVLMHMLAAAPKQRYWKGKAAERLSCARWLIRQGLRGRHLRHRAKDGQTALSLARKYHMRKMIALLRRYGAK